MSNSDVSQLVRVALFQPVLSHYRIDLFNELGRQLAGGLTLFTVDADARSNLGGAEDRLDVTRRRARTYRLGPLWLVPAALRAVWNRDWDAVVLSWNVRQVELVLALLLARMRGVPVVLWGHGFGRNRAWFPALMRRWQVRLCSAVVTYSERGAAEVLEQVPGAEVSFVLNTTGRRMPEGSDALQRVRRRIAYVGRLLAKKRVDVLVGAVAHLRADGIDLEVHIVGDGPLRGEWQRLTVDLGVSDLITWHGQITEWERVRSVIGECDLVVLPTNAGLSVVDAFAAGRAVLVDDDRTASGPEADLVVDGLTGFRYRPAEASALAARLHQLYDDPDLIVGASGQAIDVYRNALTLTGAAERFSDVLLNVDRRSLGST